MDAPDPRGPSWDTCMSKVELGQRIQAVRGILTRDAFSKRIGITTGSLRNYEKGLASPNADVVAKICAEFRVYPAWILTGAGPMYEAGGGPTMPEAWQRVNPELSIPPSPAGGRESEPPALPEATEGEETCPWCGERRTEVGKAREECRRLSEELCKTVIALRDQTAENADLWRQMNEWKDKAHALDVENVRLLATRSGTPGKRKKAAGHVDRMPMVSPPRVQEEPESFSDSE